MNIDEINARIEEIKGNDSLTPGAKEALIRSWEAFKNNVEKNPASAPADPKPETDLGTFEDYHKRMEEKRKADPAHIIDYEAAIKQKHISNEEQKKKLIAHLDRQREKEDRKRDEINYLLLKGKQQRDQEAKRKAEEQLKEKEAAYKEQLRKEYRKLTAGADWTDSETDKAYKTFIKTLPKRSRDEDEKKAE